MISPFLKRFYSNLICLYLENDELVHEEGLQGADSNKTVEPDESSVEISCLEIQNLFLQGSLS